MWHYLAIKNGNELGWVAVYLCEFDQCHTRYFPESLRRLSFGLEIRHLLGAAGEVLLLDTS